MRSMVYKRREVGPPFKPSLKAAAELHGIEGALLDQDCPGFWQEEPRRGARSIKEAPAPLNPGRHRAMLKRGRRLVGRTRTAANASASCSLMSESAWRPFAAVFSGRN
jgi:hypothetical protein